MNEEENQIQGWNYEEDQICATHHFIKLFEKNNLKPSSTQKSSIEESKQSLVDHPRKKKEYRYSDILAYRRIASEDDKTREYDQKNQMQLWQWQQANSHNKALLLQNSKEELFKNYGNVAKIEHKKEKIEMPNHKYFYYRKQNNQIKQNIHQEIANVTRRNTEVMKRKNHKTSFSSFPLKLRLATFDEYGSKEEEDKGIIGKKLSKDKISHRKCLSQDLLLIPMEDMFFNRFVEEHQIYESSEQTLRMKTKMHQNKKPFLIMK